MPAQTIRHVVLGKGTENLAARFGATVGLLQRVMGEGIACASAVALSYEDVGQIANGVFFDPAPVLQDFGTVKLVSVLPSPGDLAWGGPRRCVDVGFNDALHAHLTEKVGRAAADWRYCAHIRRFGEDVARIDPDLFLDLPEGPESVARTLEMYEEEAGESFPQDPAEQLSAVLMHMARAWDSVSARLLRQAAGAPGDAGLGLLVQDQAWSTDTGFRGTGSVAGIDPNTGDRQLTGTFRRVDFGNREEIQIRSGLQAISGPAVMRVENILDRLRRAFREEMEFSMALVGDAVIVTRVARPTLDTVARIASAVALCNDGVITKGDALMGVDPTTLVELLHAKVDAAGQQPLFSGVPASPGGASGKLVFSAAAAIRSVSNDEPCILVRRETSPEDIRGLMAARGIVTERGGATSHAAVIARGLGVPCVSGASDIKVSRKARTLTLPDGTIMHEGDMITLDGVRGKAYAGVLSTREPAVNEDFKTLMGWADEVRRLGVRANVDTPEDALAAHTFAPDGIGLCRTEHMFFEPSRMIVMREMIFAETEKDRRHALDQLLPMQRGDFIELFKTMTGKPVCIRLFDPPLHEFLPTDRDGQLGLAEALDIPVSQVVKRVEALSEYNPMLGLRGVRLGITEPEIYDMQVRAIMEAAVEAGRQLDARIEPEIMIPLVSTVREVSIVKKRMDAVAAEIHYPDGTPLRYRLGVLLETPRAILRAEDIAEYAEILSFGTNDLTQMAFGISRDDVGRFIGQYLQAGAFEIDPFHKLDIRGVGELIKIGAERGRAGRSNMVLTLCGEHGGEVEVIRFCEALGFRYVSCSPFRVPIAKLAAAQLAVSTG